MHLGVELALKNGQHSHIAHKKNLANRTASIVCFSQIVVAGGAEQVAAIHNDKFVILVQNDSDVFEADVTARVRSAQLIVV